VPKKIVNRILIDDFFSAANPKSTARMFFNMTGLASYCITGDNNLVNVECVIQYNITHPFQYLFRVKKPDIMLRNMACNTIIHCLSRMPVDIILTRGKQEIANYVKMELQKRLDACETGLSVFFVELKDIKPPDRIQRFFSDVVKANIDKEKMISEAESYRNEKLPEAQANASRALQEAEAYKKEVVLKSEGEAERCNNLLSRVHEKENSSREVLYMEAVQEIMQNVGKKHIIGVQKDGTPPARLRINCPP